MVISESVEVVEVLGSPMEVFLFVPAQGKSHPAIILCQHIPVGHTGIENDTFTLAAARRYAAVGYVVAVPFIFHWWDKAADIEVKRDGSRDDWTVADLTATYDLLAARVDVDSSRIGAVGHCWGGRVAWLAACYLDGLAACVMFYGGRIKLALGEGNPVAISLADQIGCPVAGFYGNEDRNPSPADVDDYEAALKASGVDHVFHRYDGAGHAFQNFGAPERYREAQSEDAWQKALSFLAAELQPETV